MTLKNKLYRVCRIAGRLLIKYSNAPRPSSAPYISGDGFRKLGDHIHDETSNCDPGEVKENDIVFIGGGRSREFLNEINPKIKVNYTLVSHNSDELIDESYLSLLTANIQRWYSYNVAIKDERIVPIPLGLENKHYFVSGNTYIIEKNIKRSLPKENVIFYGYSIQTRPKERTAAYNYITNHALARPLSGWQEFGLYLPEVARCKFAQSPRGSSIEGHRTWEAMYIGTIPIVLSNVMTDYFKSLSAPIMVINEWEELNSLNENTADALYCDIMNASEKQVFTMNYWVDKIRNKER
jgi:hypothetical protein